MPLRRQDALQHRDPFGLDARRTLLGAGESGNFMAAFKGVSEWFPARERAFVNGLVNAGASIGAVLAPPAVTFLALRYGWRTAFVVTGALGFVWLAAWLAVTRHAPAAAPTPGPAPRWTEMLAHRQTWGLLASRYSSG